MYYLSIVIYIFSLTQKTYCVLGEACNNFSGLFNLIFGWIGVMTPHLPAFPWLANLLLFICWFDLKKKPKISLILSSMAFVLMLTFLFFDEIIIDQFNTLKAIVSIEIGYWLWVSSAFIMILANFLKLKNKKKAFIDKK